MESHQRFWGSRVFYLFVFPIILVVADPAVAVDGVQEINQACVAAGCLPGDSGGFPVRITNPGSYILTSDIDVTGEVSPEDVNAIEIQFTGGKAVLDLNGFAIVGPTICTGGTPPSECTPTGTGVGIRVFDNEVTIRNGKVTGMGGVGIQLVTAGTVVDVAVTSCAGDGILSGAYTRVSESRAYRNGGDGISVGGDGLVLRNLISGNIGTGLSAGATTGYGNNVIADNTGGTVSGGQEIAPNVCDGNLTCP